MESEASIDFKPKPLLRLSVCPCGFTTVNEDIPIGTEYMVSGTVISATLVCGWCKAEMPMWWVFVDKRGDSEAGFLPAKLFMIHLKTKPHITPQRFAILLEPEDFVVTPTHSPAECDQDLYNFIKEHGSAKLAEFEPPPSLHFKDHYTHLTPEQFEADWMGD